MSSGRSPFSVCVFSIFNCRDCRQLSSPWGNQRSSGYRLGLSSEASLPPVSKLCEEFDCVPAAGAAACPANENVLSLLSSSVICRKVRRPARTAPVETNTADNL